MNILIKGIIIYTVLAIAVRFMGKRQIGELQPGELVTTMVLSEIATMPLQDDKFPVLSGITLIFLFVTLELVSSFLAMKSRPYRTLMQGHSVLIIKDGHLLKDNLTMIRYSTDDLMEALRLKDVFDIDDVQYAYIETNGSVSVRLKKEAEPVTPKDLNVPCRENTLPCLVISDGKIITRDFELCSMTNEKLQKILKKNNLSVKEVFLMTADKQGNIYTVKKAVKK
ncbi:MAG: DUF421 domain-containing protein [Clostridia bacterium]|nr:DUF421 domain-containing protein [Clostridia bacterium]MBO7319480.1 DUF421 domain-containing protein [Clostridia bacterium]